VFLESQNSRKHRPKLPCAILQRRSGVVCFRREFRYGGFLISCSVPRLLPTQIDSCCVFPSSLCRIKTMCEEPGEVYYHELLVCLQMRDSVAHGEKWRHVTTLAPSGACSRYLASLFVSALLPENSSLRSLPALAFLPVDVHCMFVINVDLISSITINESRRVHSSICSELDLPVAMNSSCS
jgi:hypothetical protein